MKCILFSGSSYIQSLSKKYSFQSWMLSRYDKYVSDLEGFLQTINNISPRRYIRTNTLKISSNELKEILLEKECLIKETTLDGVFELIDTRYPIGATLEYLLGYYYLQDLSSCYAVDAMELKENMKILDIAASPGGKTTYISQKINNTGLIYAIESDKKRLKKLVFNITRCGSTNVSLFNVNAISLSFSKTFSKVKFDNVILDAPCSCDGVIQKDHFRKKSYSTKSIDYCSSRQMKMIDQAISLVRPGGILLYSTCSHSPEENEFVVDSLFDKYDIRIEPYEYGLPGLTSFGNHKLDESLKNTRRFYPHIHNTLGFFIAKIRVK